MTDTLSFHRGDTIRLRFTLWQGARDVSPRRDLTGATLRDASIGQSFPPPALAFIDAALGQVEVMWTDEQSVTMRPGRVHAFRLGVEFPGEDTDVIGDTWINIL